MSAVEHKPLYVLRASFAGSPANDADKQIAEMKGTWSEHEVGRTSEAGHWRRSRLTAPGQPREGARSNKGLERFA